MAYYSLEPFGEERADLRSGIVAAVTANVWRGKGRAAQPKDFMRDFGKPTAQRMSTQELMARWKVATAGVEREH